MSDISCENNLAKNSTRTGNQELNPEFCGQNREKQPEIAELNPFFGSTGDENSEKVGQLNELSVYQNRNKKFENRIFEMNIRDFQRKK